jgi:hypothetical protein
VWSWIVVALVADPAGHQIVEDRRTVEPARLIDVALLGEIELRQVRHRVVVEREVSAVPGDAPRHGLEDAAAHSILHGDAGQMPERSRPPERRAFRVAIEEVPVPVLAGRAPRQDGGDGAGRVAEDRGEPAPLGQDVVLGTAGPG